jgi:hypothetical protein
MGAYKRIPTDTFRKLQMNAGIVCSSFDPSTGTIGSIIGATSGGLQILATPQFLDMADGVDNCPKNTMEGKVIDYWDCKITGAFLTTSAADMKSLLGAATVVSNKVTLKSKLETTDFQTLWFVGDYGDAGYLAVKLANAINTTGLSLQTADKDKGQLSFEYQGHYSMEDQDTAPLEAYIKDTVTTYPITYTLTHCEATMKPTSVATGADVVIKVVADATYSLPATVTVKVGGTTKTADTDYTWDDDSGILYILGATTTGDIDITITATTE